MQIRIGYELVYSCAQVTPMILTLNVYYSRVSVFLLGSRYRNTDVLPMRDGPGDHSAQRIAANP